jgi:hypothetical protein
MSVMDRQTLQRESDGLRKSAEGGVAPALPLEVFGLRALRCFALALFLRQVFVLGGAIVRGAGGFLVPAFLTHSRTIRCLAGRLLPTAH